MLSTSKSFGHNQKKIKIEAEREITELFIKTFALDIFKNVEHSLKILRILNQRKMPLKLESICFNFQAL